MAFKRGEPRVCSMVRAPTPEEEDRRRVSRERRTLVGERVRHANRIKGLLFAQGVFGYEPLRKGRRERLEALRTGDGRPEPHPPNAGCWCSRNKRRPYVSLIWCSTSSGPGSGLRPWIRN